jgi:hypothetical protein
VSKLAAALAGELFLILILLLLVTDVAFSICIIGTEAIKAHGFRLALCCVQHLKAFSQWRNGCRAVWLLG